MDTLMIKLFVTLVFSVAATRTNSIVDVICPVEIWPLRVRDTLQRLALQAVQVFLCLIGLLVSLDLVERAL